MSYTKRISWLDIILLGMALSLNALSISYWISTINSPEVYDFFFSVLPASPIGDLLGWGIIINVLLMFYAVGKYPDKLSWAMRATTLLYILRAFFISVTVLGVPAMRVIPNGFLSQLSYGGHDFFFSGHVALPFLFAVLFWDKKPFRVSFLVIALVFAVGTLVARTHYSIDVFAAPIIAYAVAIFSEKFLLGNYQLKLFKE